MVRHGLCLCLCRDVLGRNTEAGGGTYHAQSIATPIKAKMEYSIHEKGFSTSSSSRKVLVDPSSVPESSVRGSYSSSSTFLEGLNMDLIRSMVE